LPTDCGIACVRICRISAGRQRLGPLAPLRHAHQHCFAADLHEVLAQLRQHDLLL
jgi:hypothetical protein